MTEIRWHEKASKELSKIDETTQERILNKIEEAAGNPSHFLKGLKGTRFYRLRVGDYRIIIDWYRKENVIVILMIGKRDQIYRKI